MIERTNAQWLADLTSDSDARDSALNDLRERLQRGLYFYLSRERSDLGLGDVPDHLADLAVLVGQSVQREVGFHGVHTKSRVNAH